MMIVRDRRQISPGYVETYVAAVGHVHVYVSLSERLKFAGEVMERSSCRFVEAIMEETRKRPLFPVLCRLDNHCLALRRGLTSASALHTVCT